MKTMYTVTLIDRCYRHAMWMIVVIAVLSTGGSCVWGQRVEPRYDPERGVEQLDSMLQRGIRDNDHEEEEEDVQGRTWWFYFQRSFPYDMIPAGARSQAIHEMKQLDHRVAEARAQSRAKQDRSVQAASQWEQIGPYNIIGGRGEGAGRVKAIAVHPTELGTIYIGTAAGGVWKNTGDPKVWTPLLQSESAIAVNALDIDHANPSTIYAGTGEINPATSVPSASPAYLGNGIFRSTDDGNTWKNIGLNNVGAFSGIHVHRQNSNVIYATAVQGGAGFYRSTDRGETWTGPSPGGYLYDLAVNTLNGNTLFIAGGNSVRRSEDGGKTFLNKTSGINVAGSVRISIAMGTSDTNVVYVMVARSTQGVDGHICDIYRSTNRGDSWTQTAGPTGPTDASFFNNQGWYDQCLAVYPDDANIVVAGGIDAWQTLDGGANWTNTTRYYSNDGKAHADQHKAVFDPASGALYLSNDGGLYRSLDGGGTWEWMSQALPVTQFYSLDVDQTRVGYAYGGSQDNYTSGSTGTNGFERNWKSFLLGDGFDLVVDMTNPDLIYCENFSAGTRVYRVNINSPSNASSIDFSITSQNDFGIWSTPLAQSPADKTTLYSGRQNLWRTSNPRGPGSVSWQKLTPGNGNKISAIGLSPLDATKMMIGTVSGELRYSTNNGSAWSVSTGISTPRYVTSLLYDPVNTNRVYATLSGTGTGHVYRSDDNGATFTDISSNLPTTLPVNAIEIDPANTNHIFVGTDAGMFVTLNGGEFWFTFNDGFPLAPVMELRIHRSTRKLVAATHGRSMFQVSIDNPQVQPIIITPSGGESYGAPGKLTVRWAGFTEPVRVQLSLDGGNSFPIGRDNLTGGSVELDIPFVSTTNAVVRVQSMDNVATVVTGAFSLQPAPNVADIGDRGLHSEAIVIRNDYLWASQRGSDTLIKLLTPTLSPLAKKLVPLTGISGTIRDMAYDPAGDVFYVLQTNADYSNAKVYRMDTNGTAQGEITLPVTTISGIAIRPEGLALITPGIQGKIYVINPADGSVVHESFALENARGAKRASLAYDGLGLVQGVSDAMSVEEYGSELQRIRGLDTARVIQFTPIVLPSKKSIEFYGLAFDAAAKQYYATDTAGNFYRFTMEDIFSGVKDHGVVVTGTATMTIHPIVPNPLRGSTQVEFEVRNQGTVRVELYSASGEQTSELFSGNVTAGVHTVQLNTTTLPSGVYYVAITNNSGERVVRSVVVMK